VKQVTSFYMSNFEFLTVKNAAKILNVSSSFLYKLAQEGKLPHLRMGKKIIFDKQELIEYFKRKSTSSVPVINSTLPLPRL